ncbi:hypothetical protein HY418_02565 [Candidatus Kaiserbacteria bacterium]|nr:hypothetical protein [Candidatus Kaiserbacteria bacterium]
MNEKGSESQRLPDKKVIALGDVPPAEEKQENEQFYRRLKLGQETQERKQEIEQLGLREGTLINVWTEQGLKQGKIDSFDETWRIWVRGINPINPDNPWLCSPFDIENVVKGEE